ncbi:apicoplast pyruvate carrier 1-like [Babylonia areolata]|uniref:apicoplast pyruvate carrier 1-like n=1 Tax=Babylonia areolata TaxID=304850 RepID=UPI003FD2D087
MACCGKRVPFRGVLVVAAGFMIHLTLGTQLTFGNTNPYFISYIRKHSGPSDLHYVDGIWVQACMLMGQGVTMFFGGLLEQRLGIRVTCLLGCWLMSAGVLLTYWSLTYSYATSVLTYGIMFGLGCGIAYPTPVTCAMRWFPDHRGLMSGLIFVGFGLGSTIFNQIITLYLNPNNIPPDLTHGEDVYFTQDEVLDRVPGLFLVLGGTYAAMQLTGVVLMANPPGGASSQKEASIATDTDQNGVGKRKAVTDEPDTTGIIWHTDSPAVGNSSAAIFAADISTHDGGKKTTSDNRNVQDSGNGTPAVLPETLSVKFVVEEDSVRLENGRAEGGREKESSETYGQPKDTEETEVSMDVPPLQMLRNKQFYLVWLLFLFGGMGGVFLSSMYKSYGQSFIKDDQFFAIVGSCAAVCNAIGAIVWGHVADRLPFNVTASILYATFACTSFTFIGSEFGLKPYFLVWVCIILFAISGKFCIMPPVIARMFGNKYMSINYGLLYTSQILTAAASAFMGEMLKDILHYRGLFFLIGGLSCLGFIITFFVDARTPDGKKI